MQVSQHSFYLNSYCALVSPILRDKRQSDRQAVHGWRENLC